MKFDAQGMDSVLLFALILFFMRGGTMVWLYTFMIAWIIFSVVITKWARWYLEKAIDADFPRGIPFPFLAYIAFIFVAYFPAYITGSLVESIWWGQ